MNFSSILSEIERLDPEVYERTSQRRDALKSFGRKVAVAALPFALGSMFKKAYGRGTATVIEVLNYALTLEYLEAEFYATAATNDYAGFGSNGPTAIAKAALNTIGAHENAHVAFLTAAITGASGVPVSKPTFDFSGGNGSGNGAFATAFSNYNLFLAVAQTLEDTGVRAYKGAAPDLMSNNDVLTAALNIHSVEARHASHIRQMRKSLTFADVKPWITGVETGIAPGLVEASYEGEGNVTQATVNITTLAGVGGTISTAAATEAFDEPLTMAQVLAIVDPFIVP
jgi:hypothetical protein